MTKDYTNSFLGAIVLLLSLIFIPELKRKKIYAALVIVLILILTWLGVDKLKRDNKKDQRNEARTMKDSATIHNIDSTLNVVSENYRADTIRFENFRKELFSKFQILDINNEPVKGNTYNTYINKAGPVHIGPNK